MSSSLHLREGENLIRGDGSPLFKKPEKNQKKQKSFSVVKMGKGVIKGRFKIILKENVPVNLKSKSDSV